MSPKTSAAVRLAVLVAFAAPLLGACDFLRGTKEPEEVHVKIESSDVARVRLVTSFLFSQLQDPDCPECEAIIQLIDADTATVQLPFDRVYNFTPRLQVFLEVLPEAVGTIGMEVRIDGREWFNDFRLVNPLAQPTPEVMRFIYSYSDISF